MEQQFEVRDLRKKDKFIVDDAFLNGYARFLGPNTISIYISLCRHADRKQKCYPSIERIATEIGVGRNSIINGIKRLEYWNIIQKIREGKKLTNRYYLIDKSQWRPLRNEYVKEYSEVCQINFTSLLHKLHEFTTQTSIVRKHNSKETKKKGDMFIPGSGTIKDFTNIKRKYV